MSLKTEYSLTQRGRKMLQALAIMQETGVDLMKENGGIVMKDYNTVLEELTADQQACCLASVTEDGFPKIRAMLLPVLREGDTFYFHTNTPSEKVKQFRRNSKGCLYFFDPKAFTGLCFIGHGKICDDEAVRQRIWKEEYAVYYPVYEDFTVFTFTPVRGEMYSGFSVSRFELSAR